jgi:hypothetical protein
MPFSVRLEKRAALAWPKRVWPSMSIRAMVQALRWAVKEKTR